MALQDVTKMSLEDLRAERDRRVRNGQAGFTTMVMRLRNLESEITLRHAGLALGDRVRSGASEGGTFGQVGSVVRPMGNRSLPNRVWIHWDLNIGPSSYALDNPVRVGLIKVQPDVPKATSLNVAQAISRAIEEHATDAERLEGGLFLTPNEDTDLRITEVGAELSHHFGAMESFEIKTSDGRTFRVRVDEVHGA